MSRDRDVVVTLATYKRPELLAELLRSLEHEYDTTPFRVIIIDNDAAGSGRSAALNTSLPVDYAVEPEPGIVAARNAALRRVPDSATDIVFVDDDETVGDGWLAELMRVQDAYDVPIACGPVDSIFLEGTPEWIIRGGYIQRSDEDEGVTARLPATNNTIVSTALLRAAGSPEFDQSFSQTGGSDSRFFTELRAAGGTVAWAPRARVSEIVPLDRLTFRWVMRRYIRINNVSGRLRLSQTSRRRLAAEALASIGVGVVKTALALVRGKGLRLVDTRYVTRGIGWLGACSDRLVQEYRRPAQ